MVFVLISRLTKQWRYWKNYWCYIIMVWLCGANWEGNSRQERNIDKGPKDEGGPKQNGLCRLWRWVICFMALIFDILSFVHFKSKNITIWMNAKQFIIRSKISFTPQLSDFITHQSLVHMWTSGIWMQAIFQSSTDIFCLKSFLIGKS